MPFFIEISFKNKDENNKLKEMNKQFKKKYKDKEKWFGIIDI